MERNAENILGLLNDKRPSETSKAGPTERCAVSKLLDLYMNIELAHLIPQSMEGQQSL
jgi:hypothetical protein